MVHRDTRSRANRWIEEFRTLYQLFRNRNLTVTAKPDFIAGHFTECELLYLSRKEPTNLLDILVSGSGGC
jgi:hypothetical protein